MHQDRRDRAVRLGTLRPSVQLHSVRLLLKGAGSFLELLHDLHSVAFGIFADLPELLRDGKAALFLHVCGHACPGESSAAAALEAILVDILLVKHQNVAEEDVVPDDSLLSEPPRLDGSCVRLQRARGQRFGG